MSGHTLIIEPDSALAQRFRETLERAGIAMDLVTTMADAIEAARRCHPDVIVLDSTLFDNAAVEDQPYWSLKTNPHTFHVPIVVLAQQEQARAVGEEHSLLRYGDYTLLKNMFVPYTLFELLRFMEVA